MSQGLVDFQTGVIGGPAAKGRSKDPKKRFGVLAENSLNAPPVEASKLEDDRPPTPERKRFACYCSLA